jgi:phosphoglycerate dehydrogenase-like enzyme
VIPPSFSSVPSSSSSSSSSSLPYRIAVSSPSFSKHPLLSQEMLQIFPQTRLNREQALLPEQLKEFYQEADGIIVGLDRIDRPLLEALPRLKIVAKYGVGVDNIDLEALKERGIALGWTGGTNKRSVSELTLGLMLGLCHHAFETSAQLRRGYWNKSGGFLLSGKTVGIIGCGHIGGDLLTLLKPLGCRVLVYDIRDVSQNCKREGAEQIGSLEALLRLSDIVSLHVPLTSETYHLLNRERLSWMKSEAFLINTSRGSVVEESALKQALQEKKLAKAALDVFEEEPPRDSDFLHLESLIATPHIAGSAKEAIEAMGRSAIQHLVDFFSLSSSPKAIL